MMSPEQRRAGILLIQAIADAIRDLSAASALGGVPSGELYTALMAHGISIDSYKAMLDALERARLIKVRGHLITWTGPAAPADGNNQTDGRKENGR